MNNNNNNTQMDFGGNNQNNNRMDLFNNPMQNASNAAPNKMLFTSTSPFDPKPNTGMNDMNGMNNNPFENNNNNNFNNQAFPLQRQNNMGNSMSFGQNLGLNFGGQRAAVDSANFLGIGANNAQAPNNNAAATNGMGNNNAAAQQQGNSDQQRVYRRILQPQQKNKERAYLG